MKESQRISLSPHVEFAHVEFAHIVFYLIISMFLLIQYYLSQIFPICMSFCASGDMLPSTGDIMYCRQMDVDRSVACFYKRQIKCGLLIKTVVSS